MKSDLSCICLKFHRAHICGVCVCVSTRSVTLKCHQKRLLTCQELPPELLETTATNLIRKENKNEWFYIRRVGKWGKIRQATTSSENTKFYARSRNASNHFQGPRNVTSTKLFQNRPWVIVNQPDYYSRPYDPIQDRTTPHQNSTTRTCCKGNRYSRNKKES